MSVPPTLYGGRTLHTRWLYDDPDHPDRVTGTVTSPEWLPEDRALIEALEIHESTLCSGCGRPKHLAWHSHSEGWWNNREFVCHSCTARHGRQVVYSIPYLDEKYDATDAPDFDIETTTTPPTPPDPPIET